MVKEKFIANTILFLVITFSFVNSFAQQDLLTVVPLPKEHQFLSGNISLIENQFNLKKYFDDNESVEIALSEAVSIYSVLYEKELFTPFGKVELLIGIPSINKNFRKICETVKLIPGKDIGEEGYLILIENNRIVLSANSNKGLFYGIQTLKQLIKGSVETKSIPNIWIKDYPSFEFRGVMDDISRGPIPTLDFVKYQIRRLAELKVNLFSHYVEHVVKTKKHPSIAPDDGSYTIEEWKEISDYAKKYFITVIGSFQSFGHFQSILSNPDYAHLGESGTLISPVKEESYQFLKDIYDEMIPAFDAPFFNINCDETFDLGKAESKRLVDSIGYDGAYIQHVTRLNKYVKAHGVRTLIWGDIILDYPDIIPRLPEDMIVGTWNYDDHENFERFLKPFRGAGRDFMISPGVLNSNKIFPDFHKAFNNIKKFISEGKEAGAFGVLVCVWDDGGTALFSNDWLGVAYGAEKCWNHNSADGDFDSRFNKSVYAAINDSYTKTIWKLNELALLESTDGMTDKILFSKLVPDAGKKTKISLIDWDNTLDIVNEAEKELLSSKFNFYNYDRDYLQFIIDLYRMLANERSLLLQTSEIYWDAIKFNFTNPVLARESVLNSINNIEKLIRQITLIKSDFEKLWLIENHTYGLNIIIDKYQKKIDDYRDIKERLFLSLKNLDSGKPVLSAEKVRLAITKLPGKYFREWMMVNPIANKDAGSVSEVDYLVEMGGELYALPKVTEEFYYDAVKYRWRRVISEHPDIVNLSEIFPENNQNVVTYAFANIYSDDESVVDALAGSDDGIEVFINGKSVYKIVGESDRPENEYSFQLPLKKGRNDLMLKISQTEGGWQFTFRLPNSEVRNSKNRYRIISGEQK
jgi:hypothetical protein